MEKNELTLNEVYEKRKQQELKKMSDEINSITNDYNKVIKNPVIQLDVFNQYFNNQIKNYIEKGEDPYLNPEKNTSLPKFWEYTVGSLTTPVDVVIGEGPTQEYVATVPPFLNPIKVKPDEIPSISSISKITQELIRDKENNPYEYKKTLVTKLKPALSKVIKTESSSRDHKSNWLDAIEKVNSKSPKPKETKPSKKKEENNNEIIYQW